MRQDAAILPYFPNHLQNEHQNNEYESDALDGDCLAAFEQPIGAQDQEYVKSKEYECYQDEYCVWAVGLVLVYVVHQCFVDQVSSNQNGKDLPNKEENTQVFRHAEVYFDVWAVYKPRANESQSYDCEFNTPTSIM